MAGSPSQGEIWFVSLDPTVGHEQAGQRPALVVSVDQFNQGPAGLLIVLPITSKGKGISLHVGLDPPEGGVTIRSFVMPESIRSVSTSRLVRKLGSISAERLNEVQERMRVLLDL